MSDDLRTRARVVLSETWKDDKYREIFACSVEAMLAFAAECVAEQKAKFPVTNAIAAGGLTAEMIMQHYPRTQHQPDECQLCSEVFQIAAEAIENQK